MSCRRIGCWCTQGRCTLRTRPCGFECYTRCCFVTLFATGDRTATSSLCRVPRRRGFKLSSRSKAAVELIASARTWGFKPHRANVTSLGHISVMTWPSTRASKAKWCTCSWALLVRNPSESSLTGRLGQAATNVQYMCGYAKVWANPVVLWNQWQYT